MVQDAAGVRDCTTRREQPVTDDPPSVGFAIQFANRYTPPGDYAAFLVRCAHVLQNWRVFQTFLESEDETIDEIYAHMVVDEVVVTHPRDAQVR